MKIIKHILGEMSVWYLVDDEKNMSMLLLPNGSLSRIKEPWLKEPDRWNPASFMRRWVIGDLVYANIAEYNDLALPGMTMKNFEHKFRYKNQFVVKGKNSTEITTEAENEQGCRIEHRITYVHNRHGLKCDVKFINMSRESVTLEMLSSFALDNLSPFCGDDGTNKYSLYKYYGGWSLEGKESEFSLEDIAIDRTWAGYSNNSERFGSLGSYPVDRYFPMAVFEDKSSGIFWAAQIVHNGSWQMEISRSADTISFSGGIGDNEFAQWSKKINVGESFSAPTAYIAVSDKGINDVCYNITDMQKDAWEEYGENGLPITFNEYCTTWGNPTQKKMESYCRSLKKYGVKYAVIDAGWSKDYDGQQWGIGEWFVNKEIFPDMKQMCNMMKKNGIIPGIWFEFEVTTDGSPVFASEFDYMHLKKNGKVINHRGSRSFWDFRRSDVRNYLKKHVIDFLKEYGFGYIKVDYNTNIGLHVDSENGDGDGLREHLWYVREFFKEMKREIPDLIIENCASGGHRLEPSMIGVSAVSSFSDAHETNVIPCIAANLHKLMLPAQELIWAVLHKNEDIERTKYSLAATFLGRMCLSGEIDELRPDQEEALMKAVSFYNKAADILINGRSMEYGNRSNSLRKPDGTQVIVRKTDKEMLVVCHSFNNPSDDILIPLDNAYYVADDYYSGHISIADKAVVVKRMNPFNAEAVILRKTD